MNDKETLYWIEQFENNIALSGADKGKVSLALEAMEQCKDAIAVKNRLQAELAHAVETICEQKAEIERLKDSLNKSMAVSQAVYKTETLVKQAKAEAVKEFAERFKEKMENTPFGVNCTGETEEYKNGCLYGLVAKQNHVIGMIGNLVKEMESETNV